MLFRSTLIFAGQHLHLTAQQDLHIASAHTFATTVGEGASWFSHAGGIRSIAQAGSQTIQAHTDEMEILADQSVTMTSSNDEIHILAKEKIVLQAGQSSVTLEGSNITFACPGTFSVKGGGNAFLGPGNGAADLEALPAGAAEGTKFSFLDEQFMLLDSDDKPIADMPYIITTAEGKVYRGVTNSQGGTSRIDTTSPQNISIKPDLDYL